jgi:hypothetical protein
MHHAAGKSVFPTAKFPGWQRQAANRTICVAMMDAGSVLLDDVDVDPSRVMLLDGEWNEASRRHRTVLIKQLFSQWKAGVAAARMVSSMFSDFDVRNDRGGDYSVNQEEPKIERLSIALNGHASLFRNMSGFLPDEWEEFCQAVCPILINKGRRARAAKLKGGRPTKLAPDERLLSTVLFLKNGKGCRSEAVCWNASKSTLNDDVTFICEAIVESLMESEICWPNAAEREVSRSRLGQEFEGCIGHIDGTLCKIRKPRIPMHKRYFNNRKNMYCMNTVVVVDHDGLIIYVDAGFAGSFHDARCVSNSDLGKNWRDYFTGDELLEQILEFLMGDPG